MKLYQFSLVGYDAYTDGTDDLVKWIKAPSLEALGLFISKNNLKLDGSGIQEIYQDGIKGFIGSEMTEKDGVDAEIDVNGNLTKGKIGITEVKK